MQNHKKLNLWDSCRMAHDAWSYVNNAILKSGWDILFGHESIRCEEVLQILTQDADKAVELLHTLPGCERYNATGVLNWFKIENIRDIVMKICTVEVLRYFENDTIDQVNIDIVEDEVGPFHSKIPMMS